MKNIPAIFLCVVLFVAFGLAFAQVPVSGLERVEVAPTKEACCQNGKDRATAASAKLCHPAKVDSLSVGECQVTINKSVKEFFDCERSWQAVCASEATSDSSAKKDPCKGVTCSGHGSCKAAGSLAVCQCSSGYGPAGDGQACQPNEEFLNKLEALIKEKQ